MHFETEVLQYFLDNQEQLFDEPVADTLEEADDFLDMVMAEVLEHREDVRDYLDQLGMDVQNMDDQEILSQSEVFRLPDGRFLLVQG